MILFLAIMASWCLYFKIASSSKERDLKAAVKAITEECGGKMKYTGISVLERKQLKMAFFRCHITSGKEVVVTKGKYADSEKIYYTALGGDFGHVIFKRSEYDPFEDEGVTKAPRELIKNIADAVADNELLWTSADQKAARE